MTFFRQLPAWSPLTIGALLSGVRATWLTNGRRVRDSLGAVLRSTFHPHELYLTDSGTSALTLALRVAEAATHAPVALPAYCCYDVATAADGAGVPFHLYDIDPSTLSPDLESLRRAFEGGARTVVVAHLYGVPADLAAVQQVAAEFGALIVEDAAQGSGCEWRGRPAGAHGALGILSFGRGKGVTGGRGGALLVNESALAGHAKHVWSMLVGPREPRGSLRDLALLTAQWLFGRPTLYWIPASLPFLGLGETVYREPHPAHGISSLAAGVLLRTLPLVPAEVAVRRGTATRLRELLPAHSLVSSPDGWQSGWLRLPVLLGGAADRRMGMMPGYPQMLSELSEFGGRRLNVNDGFPGAAQAVACLSTAPTHSRLTASARDRLEGVCRSMSGG